MKLKTARILAGAYLVAALVCVTWPGLVPFARIEPFVLGLPFSMAWITAWVAGGPGRPDAGRTGGEAASRRG